MEAIQTVNIEKPRTKGISGSTLKIIAIVSMLIDHIGAIILERMLILKGMPEAVDSRLFNAFIEANASLYYTDIVFRMIGRIALPIFCFLLVEGFLYTHNLKKYLTRLFIFALISEIPFNLAFFGRFFEWGYQNIFFTLFLGILAIAGLRMAEEKKQWSMIGRVLFGFLSVGIGIGAAMLLKTDYNMFGVITIIIIYLFRRRKILGVGIGCAILMEPTAFISLIPIYLYNGTRGINLKWIFYLFYPVHILLLYLIACALGLGHVTF